MGIIVLNLMVAAILCARVPAWYQRAIMAHQAGLPRMRNCWIAGVAALVTFAAINVAHAGAGLLMGRW